MDDSTPVRHITDKRLAQIREFLRISKTVPYDAGDGHVADMTPAAIVFLAELLAEHGAVLADNERLTAQVAALLAGHDLPDRHMNISDMTDQDKIRALHNLCQTSERLRKRFVDVARERRDENQRLKADLQRAESEVAAYAAAQSADIAAGSYAGEVERLAAELASQRAVSEQAARVWLHGTEQLNQGIGQLNQELADTKDKLAATREVALDLLRALGRAGLTARRLKADDIFALEGARLAAKRALGLNPPALSEPTQSGEADAPSAGGTETGQDGAQEGPQDPGSARVGSGSREGATETQEVSTGFGTPASTTATGRTPRTSTRPPGSTTPSAAPTSTAAGSGSGTSSPDRGSKPTPRKAASDE